MSSPRKPALGKYVNDPSAARFSAVLRVHARHERHGFQVVSFRVGVIGQQAGTEADHKRRVRRDRIQVGDRDRRVVHRQHGDFDRGDVGKQGAVVDLIRERVGPVKVLRRACR